MWRQEVFPEVKSLLNCCFYTIVILNVVTAKTLSPQKWRMCRQEHFGLTALIYNILCTLSKPNRCSLLKVIEKDPRKSFYQGIVQIVTMNVLPLIVKDPLFPERPGVNPTKL